MIFRQLFDADTSTYTYLLADDVNREALLIDPVLERFERDRTLLKELGLVLRYTLETHVHADHVTAGGKFRKALGSKCVVSSGAGVPNADTSLRDGERLRIGAIVIEAVATPGHTNGCVTYVYREGKMAFTGDTLLIRGCGRTDFQQGNAALLYRSVRDRIFALADDTLLYPAHDYQGRTVTTVAEERAFNPRLGDARDEAEFVSIMSNLKLAYPKRMDVAVPANLSCGVDIPRSPDKDQISVAQFLVGQGRQDAELWLGDGI